MKIDDLPKPLQDWLLELEGVSLRIERLWETLEIDDPSYMLDWLQVAYEIGVREGKKDQL